MAFNLYLMKILKFAFLFLSILLLSFLVYANALIGVDIQAKAYLADLEQKVKDKGYKAQFYVVSGKRCKLHNYLLARFGGAASKSRHLTGQAIDIIVLDVNKDGKINTNDVNIIYNILDTEIIKNKGGLGSYKNESSFFDRQMLHFDSRGSKARWHR